MISKLFGLFGDSNEKVLKRVGHLVEKVNSVEASLEGLSDDTLREKSREFKQLLDSGTSTEELLPEAFAVVREAAKRALGQRHFDEQILGGIILHQGKIAEMKTGEGKTLVATLPVYLNALEGLGVHVVTVNDYLAKRDAQWMGPVYRSLGLSVACLQNQSAFIYDPDVSGDSKGFENLRGVDRKEAYAADITYGTNNEFGFDYLRDNMVVDITHRVQRGLRYAIVDEVDNILIDEARTPLIISGPAQEGTQLYSKFAGLVPRLVNGDDYTVDEKHRSVAILDSGVGKMEGWLNLSNLYDPDNYINVHYVENALRALAIYRRDKDYVVRDGEVLIVDDFTGRLMPGRRYGDGLHQAIEAKEGVKVRRENITFATITLQNYFRMYQKLAGMTGTASTEAEELAKIYKLEVVVIPTHEPMVRQDYPDLVYATEKAKFEAIVQDLAEFNATGRPVLVGTVSIEKSELLSEMLRRRGIKCEILNAKQHEREALIVAQAGKPGAITVATNMAGRGTDIILGGNPTYSTDEDNVSWKEAHDNVMDLGGLHIIGTERHESRRIDNQLRGRAGRQGDPGSSRFYVSLEDEVMRRFGGDRIKGLMGWAGVGEEIPIENKLVNRSIEASQSKVEGYHFEIRKQLVEYDDVANMHRDVIYSERSKVLEGVDLKANIQEMIEKEISTIVSNYSDDDDEDGREIESLVAEVEAIHTLSPAITSKALAGMHSDEITEQLLDHSKLLYLEREQALGAEEMRTLERLVMLRVIDSHWVQHLTSMENLRQGIGLQAFGQRDPLVMYKREGHEMFQGLLERIQHDIVHTVYHVGLAKQNGSRTQPRSVYGNSGMSGVAGRQSTAAPSGRKVGRNEFCPCGSGKKYKRCHGMAA